MELTEPGCMRKTDALKNRVSPHHDCILVFLGIFLKKIRNTVFPDFESIAGEKKNGMNSELAGNDASRNEIRMNDRMRSDE